MPTLFRQVPPSVGDGSPAATSSDGADSLTAVGPYLPQPPSDFERDQYLGPQHRWLPVASFGGYLLIVVSLSFFIGNHVWTAALLLPTAVGAASTLLSLIATTRRRRVTLIGHRALVRGWSPARPPAVDVFLPSAGEDLAVIGNTFRYVAQLRWAGTLRVHVLDDSGRDEVRLLAEQRGFAYLSRPNRGHLKKAGNLRYGYEHSNGDLIAIFDADFVPRADFLHELVPYFDDPTTALVQSPQYFDLHRDMNWVQRAAGSTQVLFYRYVQPGRDASRAAICVGTSAMYRRAALVVAGGFAQISHSEDVHTGVSLMAAGYQIRYIPTVVSKGVCPDTFDSFVTQQYRWCGGSMALLTSGRFHSVRMTVMQRVCYWSGFTYYISTALNLVTSALPTLLMVYFFAGHVRVQNYVFVMLALMVRQSLIRVISGGTESLVSLSRIQTTYSFAHLVLLWDRVTRHKDEGWVPTGASTGSSRARRILRTARVWLIGYQVLLWTGIAWRIPEYGLSRYWPMVFFALFNLYVTYPIMRGDEHLPPVMLIARRITETGRARQAVPR